jgi:5-amino-6-(5-phospho-D-ribitylamino)uracil phosphatase
VLYVSDLDGTLLQDNAILSSYAFDTLSDLLEKGILFTFATARSVVSARQILGDLPLRLPVVCANGAYLSNYHNEQHFRVQGLAKPMDRDLLDLIRARRFQPFASTYDGKRDGIYLAEIANEAMAWYEQDRIESGDTRLNYVDDMHSVLDQEVICFNVMERWEPLAELEQELRDTFGQRIHMYFYENWYSPEWYWLSIYDEQATKANALRQLLAEQDLSPEQLTVFGDQLNDLSMFELVGTALAMHNAHPAVKAKATQVIGANHEDSVVRYILSQLALPKG